MAQNASPSLTRASPGSLILTFYGAYGRGLNSAGTVPVATLIRLLGAVGVDPPSVRSAVSRLKRRGLLTADNPGSKAAGYRPSPAATQLLEDGDDRIYARPEPDGTWLLAVFSVPESERQRRHVLRSRLARLGFGNAAPGIWIAPSHLEEETRHTLDRLELTPYVDLFRGGHVGFEPTAGAVARWWDLEAIAERHRAFLQAHEPVLRAWSRRRRTPPEAAYRDYLPALDAWRRLPYADPGLPPSLLPARWPGERAAKVFFALHEKLRDAGRAYVEETAAAR
ncbi:MULTISPECIES: PaaX family transcriptional regulator C-terminal domain-containing protein [unclassified Streptomyces]|uniref:PaaX family transcriptional regulator n=1 Tax=unclassified Streptomyces TaxID=2593676 RepID=UPI002DDA0432|nr:MULTISPECIES: PaaX family transcriptional regulator C-terminal domain-containing protein [unclassified Streptomyces]WSA91832.1 PaaX family transcriptional regulator [Streptomyces sp. NBC_01795]WSB76202.1 PaaX family transcriptional regulator [Streptomyces sp. NBC_01775]WSS15524.1 PaaX family transcriptional regulator [Streptomyces sp. NBC_01186]WSS44366.1 PaaX family transcriptional regulator [Streptomyces sp. NBC_01187]